MGTWSRCRHWAIPPTNLDEGSRRSEGHQVAAGMDGPPERPSDREGRSEPPGYRSDQQQSGEDGVGQEQGPTGWPRKAASRAAPSRIPPKQASIATQGP